MNKRIIETMRQPIELRKHGAETGLKSKAKKLNTELSSNFHATTAQKSNKMPVDPYYWPQKTGNASSRNKTTTDTQRVEYDFNNANDNSEDEDYIFDNTSDATQFSDDEPILKVSRIPTRTTRKAHQSIATSSISQRTTNYN